MGSIRVGFSTPKVRNPVRRALDKLMGVTCHQAWFYYFDYNWDLAVVLAPHDQGFRLVPHSRFKQENDIVAIIRPPVPLDTGLRWALVHLAQAFVFSSWLSRERYLLKATLHAYRSFPFHPVAGVLSARLVADALREASYPGCKQLPPGDVTPDELLRFMSSHNDL